MNDMSSTIIAKSDQINAADLIGAPRTITIREVRIKGDDDQPVSVLIEGDTKAFRPCKGVRRLMVRVWGADASKYVGQSMTLFQDPTVTWAGKQEGGIRVSHMTGLREKIVELMRTSREKTKPYEIHPLVAEQTRDKAAEWVAEQVAATTACTAAEALDALTSKGAKAMGKLQTDRPELHAQVLAAYAEKRSQIGGNEPGETMLDDEDPFATPEHPFTKYVNNKLPTLTTPAELDSLLAEIDAQDFPADVADALRGRVEARMGEAG